MMHEAQKYYQMSNHLLGTEWLTGYTVCEC